ncbi:MAG: hypothetical protein KDA45_10400 [Planctomycetales bacterium]|nr:hypothetical protein [Planctomycetales bacterium]
MIIDVNAFLGHYPFRSLRGNTAESMLQTMDGNGIDYALVSSLHAVFRTPLHLAGKGISIDCLFSPQTPAATRSTKGASDPWNETDEIS